MTASQGHHVTADQEHRSRWGHLSLRLFARANALFRAGVKIDCLPRIALRLPFILAAAGASTFSIKQIWFSFEQLAVGS